MFLTGQLGKDDKRIFDELTIICGKIEFEFDRILDQGLLRNVTIQQYNSLSAIVGTLINLCNMQRVSSQASCVLLRTVIDATISILAFCRDPEKRALLYWNFDAVLDWQFVCFDEKHVGSPLIPKDGEEADRRVARKEDAWRKIQELGMPYLASKKVSKEQLMAVIQRGKEKPGAFRSTWFPETRRNILKTENIEWVYDVLYRRLCSCVHSDSAASKMFANTDRRHIVTIALEFWGYAMYRLVDTFKIRLSSEHKHSLRIDYQSLQYSRTE